MNPEVKATLQASLDYFSSPDKHAVCTYYVRENGEDSQAHVRSLPKDMLACRLENAQAMCVVTAVYHFAPDANVAQAALQELIPDPDQAEYWNNAALHSKGPDYFARAQAQGFRDPDAYKMVTDRLKEVLA